MITHMTDLAVSFIHAIIEVADAVYGGGAVWDCVRKEGCSLSSCSDTIPELSRFFPRDIAPLVLSRVSLLLLMVALASEFVRFSSLVSFP